jgi:hypothetical protein
MAIRVSRALPVTKPLVVADPSGNTTVTVKQPDAVAIRIREDELSNRTPRAIDNLLYTEVRVNRVQLRYLELWLTFGGTTLVVEIEDPGTGDVSETISFSDDMNRQQFYTALEKIDVVVPGVLVEWQGIVREVVPQWDSPFW